MELCKFCGRKITNKGSLIAHEMCCEKNPKRVRHRRSIYSGAQKGNKPWNVGKKMGRDPRWDEKYPEYHVFCENSTYARAALKKRILQQNLIEYKCALCGIGPEWMNAPMPLILDHINGINNDNRLMNLRFICSNCDSQLTTYKSKNKRKVKPIGDGSCLESSRA